MAQAADWTLQPVSSLQKLTATAPGVLEPFSAQPVQLRAVRGEWESFQFVVTAGQKPIDNLQITANGMATIKADFLPAKNLAIFRENYVYIGHPSGNRRLEKLWWPDALIPLDWQSIPRIEAGKSAVFWATLKIPLDAAPGAYFGELDIKADGENRRLALAIEVENTLLPAPTLRSNVAVYYDVLRDWYAKNAGKTYSDEEWAAQKQRYYDFLLDYRLNAYDLPVDWGTSEAEKYLRDSRVLSVRTPPLDNPNFSIALRQLEATGTKNKAYYYWIDEPAPERFDEVRQTTEKLRKIGIPHCVTVHPNAKLENAVDIWCPNLGDFFGVGHLDWKKLAAERKKGRETWIYTMVEPKFPYPTWLVDDDAWAIRLYGPLMKQNGISGFVYSMAHGWGPKPLENIESFAGTNGDGTLLYPGEIVGGIGPMPSIRLMLLRDTIEDYELNRKSFTPFLPYAGQPIQTVLGVGNGPVPFGKPQLDGALKDKAWNEKSAASGGLLRWDDADKNGELSYTPLWVCHDKKFLYLAVRANQAQSGEWIAADFAPENAEYRLRFVATQKGNLVVEKHTREGHFRLEVPEFQAKIKRFGGFYNVEMQIPLAALPDKKQFRFDVVRRTSDAETGTKIMLRASPNTSDPFLMPLLNLQN